MSHIGARAGESGQIFIMAVAILIPLSIFGLHILVEAESKLDATAVHGLARAQVVSEAGRRAAVLNLIAKNNSTAASEIRETSENILTMTSDGMLDAFFTSGFERWPPEEGTDERRALDARWKVTAGNVRRLRKKLAQLNRENEDALRALNCDACEKTLIQVPADLAFCGVMALHQNWFKKYYSGEARSYLATFVSGIPLFNPYVTFRREPVQGSTTGTAAANSPCTLHSAHGTRAVFDVGKVVLQSGFTSAYLLPRAASIEEFERAWEVDRTVDLSLEPRPNSLAMMQKKLMSVLASSKWRGPLRVKVNPVKFRARVIHMGLFNELHGSSAVHVAHPQGKDSNKVSPDPISEKIAHSGFDPHFAAALWIERLAR